jgi:SAM-dependent methyltransferase
MEKPGSNINDHFFEGIYKDVWRHLVPPGLSEAEVDFIEDLCRLKNGDEVLDLMCGYGRHTLELAKRGYAVTAVDNSKDYIEEIARTAKADNLPVAPVCSTAQDVVFKKTFAAAICMGNSFAFFSEEEALSILKKISKNIKQGGCLIINTWVIAEIAIRYFKEKDWYEVGGFKYLVSNQYFLSPSRIETDNFIIGDDGSTQTIKGVDYIFTIAEMSQLLRKGGFVLQEVFSTPRNKKFKLGDTRAYLVAAKLY